MSTVRRQRQLMLVDVTLNWALSVVYFIYAAFGLVGIISGIPSYITLSGDWTSGALSTITFLAGMTAGITALNAHKSKRWERWEFYSTATLVTFVAVYNSAQIYLALQGVGNRGSVAVIALALIVMPVWKLTHILRKNAGRV